MRWRAVMQTRRTATARQARRWPSVIVVLQFPATVTAIQDKCSHPGGWALVELCQGLHSTQQVNMRYGACESPRVRYNAAPCEKHHQFPQLHNVHTGVLLGEALPTVLFPHATNASQNAIAPSIGVHGSGEPVSSTLQACKSPWSWAQWPVGTFGQQGHQTAPQRTRGPPWLGPGRTPAQPVLGPVRRSGCRAPPPSLQPTAPDHAQQAE